ncbi:hypothetical protein SEPCBS57363_001153 [Sporothrix epigloea]|uniref:SAP domain-containing protein n=1 Tax=Sporothrix epigloea TaxID=1892477 RepID=A0ABP0D8Z6_9PEZI
MASAERDWSKLTVVNLRAELKQRELSTAGRKDELVQRLIAYEEDADNGNHGDEDVEMIGGEAVVADAPKENEVAEAVETAALAEKQEDPPAIASPAPPPSSTVPMSEVVQDEQKRKRRSVTPPPSLHTESAERTKRLRTDAPVESAPVVLDTEMETLEASASISTADMNSGPGRDTGLEDSYANNDNTATVIPAIHPATTAIYICHLMRPLRPQTLGEKMDALATPPASANGDIRESSAVLRTYLDPIKTHAFVVFGSISAAARARAALHDQVWPDESNRRTLWVDYVPSASVNEWIDIEEQAASGGASGGSRRSIKKWEVVYSKEADSRVTTTLLEAGTCNSNIVPGRILYEPSSDNRVPVDSPARRSPPPFDAPRGPKSDIIYNGGRLGATHQLTSRSRFEDGVPPPPPPPPPPPLGRDQPRRRDPVLEFLDDEIRTTRTLPALKYQPISLDVARRRQETIRLHTMPRPDGETHRSPSPGPSRDGQSHYTKTHNRYTFEQGDKLIDRGPEQFDGIRPPHRELERQRQHRNFGPTSRNGGSGNGGGRGNRIGGGGGNGRRHWRNNRSSGGGRNYDDYRPDRDGPNDRNGEKRDDRRNNDRSGNRKRWGGRRDRRQHARSGRDEREGRLGGLNESV